MADDAIPISFLAARASAPTASPRRPASPLSAGPVFRELPAQNSQQALNIELLRDVELTVKIELGRSRMRLEEVLQLGPGAVVELDRLAGDPVDMFVNDRLIARGEVVVLNEKFAVRLTEVASPMKED